MEDISAARVRLHRRRRSLAEDVRDLIAVDLIFSGEVPPGSKLPAEQTLATRYGVSRVTVRAAIHSLREAGLVTTRQGLSAVVLPRSTLPLASLDRLSSLEAFARESNVEMTSTDIECDVVDIADEGTSFGAPHSGTAIRLTRTKLLAEKRVAWCVDYVPDSILDVDYARESYTGSTLDFLTDNLGLEIQHADTELIPIALPTSVARLLKVAKGTVGLRMDMVMVDDGGNAVAWGHASLLPEHFRFMLRRRRHAGLPGSPGLRNE